MIRMLIILAAVTVCSVLYVLQYGLWGGTGWFVILPGIVLLQMLLFRVLNVTSRGE